MSINFNRLIVPVSMIICCDIMSYMFGFFWGKTPLIKLSPKKTWEGFIGGALSTIVFGLVLSSFMVDKPSFVCPVESYYQDNLNCTIPPSFQIRLVFITKLKKYSYNFINSIPLKFKLQRI
jgi:phosphatidate cytidylyltransferase